MTVMNDLARTPSSDQPSERPARQRKPDWIRVRAPVSEGYHETRRLMRELNLNTVCEEAACPNIGECWTKKHATVMILGDVCTRACAFCNVKTGMPRAVDPMEPENTAIAAARMGLEHIVITSVDRDDLPDGGAMQFVKVIEALRRTTPKTTIEILTPDFRGKMRRAVEMICEAVPDVYNHNLETVRRLTPSVRHRATYDRSLRVLAKVKDRLGNTVHTKSGMMLGLGETQDEVLESMRHLRDSRCDILTLGQYLQPTLKHLPVVDYIPPSVFDTLRREGQAMGFTHVASGPLVRSSYHADEFSPVRNA